LDLEDLRPGQLNESDPANPGRGREADVRPR